MVKSIFELEKRTNIKKETHRIETYLSKKQFSNYPYGHRCSFWEMVNSCFQYWPYRYTATSYEEFFDLIELPLTIKDMTEEECFYYLQFILDFIFWLTDQEAYDYDTIEYQLHYIVERDLDCFKTLIDNIRIIAELSNYKIEKMDNHYTFIKRDADVDSVLSVLEDEDDLRIALLEYNDFRIENDIKEKRIILKQIGDYLEPRRKSFNNYNKTLTDCIFNLLNKLKIRHFDTEQKEFTEKEYLKWYNKLFKMMIHLIRTSAIVEIQKEVKDLCS